MCSLKIHKTKKITYITTIGTNTNKKCNTEYSTQKQKGSQKTAYTIVAIKALYTSSNILYCAMQFTRFATNQRKCNLCIIIIVRTFYSLVIVTYSTVKADVLNIQSFRKYVYLYYFAVQYTQEIFYRHLEFLNYLLHLQ